MANTTIQIKRSSVTNQPSTLSIAEPAYSYLSNVLFIGTSAGNGVQPVGGSFYVSKVNTAYDAAVAAFNTANAAYAQANTRVTTGKAIAMAIVFG